MKVGLLSFGGPAGQIAVMHRLLVAERRWVSESRFLHALNYCMLLPGPEAQQLATYIGWLLHRTVGGLVAGTLFVLPGFVSILALSVLYAQFRDFSLVQGLFFGLKPAVAAVVVQAVMRIGRRALRSRTMIAIAAAAFVGIYFLEVPFPLIVLAAGITGLAVGRLAPSEMPDPRDGGHGAANDRRAASVDSTASPSAVPMRAGPARGPGVLASVTVTLRTVALWLAIWWIPIAVVALLPASPPVLLDEGVFFGQAAVVTFGGAYAVLAYVAQRAVETYGWLAPGEMLDGLGMAETTPGPLIQVVQFVGFMGAYRNPGGLDPLVAGVLGSIVTTWATFAPSFLFIFAGAPHIERLRGNRTLSSALGGVTSGVVGVVLNLAVWFFLHVLFGTVDEVRVAGARVLVPAWETVSWPALAIATLSALALFRLRWGMATTLAAAAVAGVAYGWLS